MILRQMSLDLVRHFLHQVEEGLDVVGSGLQGLTGHHWSLSAKSDDRSLIVVLPTQKTFAIIGQID